VLAVMVACAVWYFCQKFWRFNSQENTMMSDIIAIPVIGAPPAIHLNSRRTDDLEKQSLSDDSQKNQGWKMAICIILY
jgi:hypothetical protein